MPTQSRSQEVSADEPDNVFINLVIHYTEACRITMSSNQYLVSDSKRLQVAQQQAFTEAVDMVLLKLSAPSLGYL